MKKILVRVVASKPKVPFAPDLALFTFERVGRTFEVLGFDAVTQAQLDATWRGPGAPTSETNGWLLLTPAQRKLLVRKARAHAPYWRSFRAEVAA